MGKLSSIKFKVLIPWLLLIVLLVILLIGKSHQNNRFIIINNNVEKYSNMLLITNSVLQESSRLWIESLKVKEGEEGDFFTDFNKSNKIMEMQYSEILSVYNSPEIKIHNDILVLLAEYKKNNDILKNTISSYVKLNEKGPANTNLLHEMLTQISLVKNILESLVQNFQKSLLELDKEKDERLLFSDNIIIIVICVIIAVIFVLIVYQSFSITKPLIEMKEWAKGIKQGEKYNPIKIKNKDEIGKLSEILNDMVLELDKNYRDIQNIVNERTIELSRKNQDLEDFCNSISSDLRTPLRAIREFLTFAFEENSHKISKEGVRFYSIVQKNVITIDETIKDLIEFSKVATTELDYVVVNMYKMVSKKVEECKKSNNVVIQINELPELQCDYNLFKILWENLIDNAVKFSAKIDNPLIMISGEEDHSFVTYKIQDNGVGFDSSKSNDIFNLFTKLHYKDDYEGNGIGLSLIKKVVDRHGGFISLESKVNVGTTFTLSFPKRAKVNV